VTPNARLRVLAGAAAAAVLLSCWRPLLVGGLIPVDGNLMTLSFPHWARLRAALAAGRLPLWDPTRDLGEPWLSDPQAMVLYPPMWLGAAFGSFAGFLRYWIVLHSLLAAGFAGALARRRLREPAAAAAAALVYAAGGSFLARATFPNHLAAAAWMPAVLLAQDLRSPRLVGAALAMLWLAGFPPFFVLGAAAGLAWACAQGPDAVRDYARGGLWGAGLAAVQALPFLEMLSRADRGVVVSPAVAAQFSMPPAALLKEALLPQWVRLGVAAPGDPAITTFYAGPVALALAAWGARTGGRAARLLAAATLAALVLSLGGSLPGFARAAPLHVFRFPANWLVPASLGAALLAACGVAALPSPRARWVAVALVAADLTAFAGGPRAAWARPALVSEEPALARGIAASGLRVWHAPPAMSAWHAQTLDSEADYEAMRGFLAPSYGTAFGVREAASYQVLRQASVDAFLRRLAAGGPGSPRLDWARVGTVVTLRRGARRAAPDTLEAERRTVGAGRVFLPDRPDGSAAIDADEPGLTRATVVAPGGALAVLSEAAYPGWSARVDGRRVPLEHFDGVFLAARVPPGRHSLEFRFTPWSVLGGLALSAAALAAALGRRGA
jgi:hypothetical protein